MPTGMMGASPNPLPRAARRPSRIGSSSKIVLVTGRSITSSTFEKAPLGKAVDGIFPSLDVAGFYGHADSHRLGGKYDVPQVRGFGLFGRAPARDVI